MATMSDNTRFIVQQRSNAVTFSWEKVERIRVEQVEIKSKAVEDINAELGWEKYRVIKTVDSPREIEHETDAERHARHWEEKYRWEDRDPDE